MSELTESNFPRRAGERESPDPSHPVYLTLFASSSGEAVTLKPVQTSSGEPARSVAVDHLASTLNNSQFDLGERLRLRSIERLDLEILWFVDDADINFALESEHGLYDEMASLIAHGGTAAISHEQHGTIRGCRYVPVVQFVGELSSIHFPDYREAVENNSLVRQDAFRNRAFVACHVEPTESPGDEEDAGRPEFADLLSLLRRPSLVEHLPDDARLANQVDLLAFLAAGHAVIERLDKDFPIHFSVIGDSHVVIQEKHEHDALKKQWLIQSDELASIFAARAKAAIEAHGTSVSSSAADSALATLYSRPVVAALDQAVRTKDRRVTLSHADFTDVERKWVYLLLEQLAVISDAKSCALTDAGVEWFEGLPAGIAQAFVSG